MFHDQGLTRVLSAAALAAALLLAPAARAADCDTAAGEAAFSRCAACHSRAAGAHGVGPSLHGLAGRAAGSAPGFAFSPALRNSGITWDAESLDAFIAAPAAAIPGNRMPFTGIRDDLERAALICFLLGGA
jgi:cytochrome c2